MSYHEAIGGLVITERAHCLSFLLHIHYTNVTSERFEHSVCHESLLTCFIYMYISVNIAVSKGQIVT